MFITVFTGLVKISLRVKSLWTGFYPVNLGKIRNEVLKTMKEKTVKNASLDQNKVSGRSVVKNRETRKAIADAIAGKGLSRTYDSIEEMFDDLDEENPFDVVARHAIEESRSGRTVTLEDFERRMKKNVSRETAVKSAKGLKNT